MIAVITAGGRIDDAEFAAAVQTEWKALIPFGDAKLVDYAIAAARTAGAERIVLVGPPAVAHHCGGRIDGAIGSSGDGRASLASALRSGSDRSSLLLSTSDLPFIDGAALGEFCRAATKRGADAAMPISGAGAYRAAFPNAPEHCTRLGKNEVANGSVFYFASGVAARRSLEIAQRLFAARKSLWAMARLLSPALLFRFATGSLEIEHVEAYAARRFGLSAAALGDLSPRLCFDIDTLADYRYAVDYRNAVSTGPADNFESLQTTDSNVVG